MKKVFSGQGEVHLSRERGGVPSTDLLIPCIPCAEAGEMWGRYQEDEGALGERLIFLLGHLADGLGEHRASCPINSAGPLERVRKTYWTPSCSRNYLHRSHWHRRGVVRTRRY